MRGAHFGIGDVAQSGLDGRPHALLVGRQMQPLLDAADLRVVEQEARPVGMMGSGGDRRRYRRRLGFELGLRLGFELGFAARRHCRRCRRSHGGRRRNGRNLRFRRWPRKRDARSNCAQSRRGLDRALLDHLQRDLRVVIARGAQHPIGVIEGVGEIAKGLPFVQGIGELVEDQDRSGLQDWVEGGKHIKR